MVYVYLFMISNNFTLTAEKDENEILDF